MENKQTALEWLRKQLETLYLDTDPYESVFDKAKEMEKEQILHAYNFGVADAYNYTTIEGEVFYNETYGA